GAPHAPLQFSLTPQEASALVILRAAGAKDLLFCRRERPSLARGPRAPFVPDRPQAGPSLARGPRAPFVPRPSASRSFARARAAPPPRMTTPPPVAGKGLGNG